VVCQSRASLLVRAVQRIQERAALLLVDATGAQEPVTLRSDDTKGQGWIDYVAVWPIPGARACLDLEVDERGFTQLVLIDFTNTTNVIKMTLTGNDTAAPYEVVSIAGFNDATGDAFVITTHAGPMERHLYAVNIDKPNVLTPLTTGEGYYSASVSPRGGFYLLNYQGPDVPTQALYQYHADGTAPSLVAVVQDNADLKARLAGFALPHIIYSTLTVNGNGALHGCSGQGLGRGSANEWVFWPCATLMRARTEVNVVELRPPMFDQYTKNAYPMLLRVYGGPSSQLVLKRFSLDWHTHLASEKNFVVVMVP